MRRITSLFAALAIIALVGFSAGSKAADERTVFQGNNGMAGHIVSVLRNSFGKVYLTVRVFNVSVASNRETPTGGSVVSPVKGKISLIYTVVTASIASDPGLEAATDLVGSINGTEVTGGTVTLASGATSATSDSATPTALNTLNVGDVIRFDSNGKTTMDDSVLIVIEIDRDV